MSNRDSDWMSNSRQGTLGMAGARTRFFTLNGAGIGAPPDYTPGLQDRIGGLQNPRGQTPPVS